MYPTYEEIAKSLHIKKGDVIFLSSDISLLSYEALENSSRFNGDEFLNIIIEKIGEEGTLLLPTYNWSFCQGKPYDYNKTIGKTGYLGNIALKRNDFKRTKNPIYSFAVYGRDKDYLCNLDPVISFGRGSVFEYLHEKNAQNIIINVHFNDHYTICHYVEQVYGCSYRYNKYFKSIYIDEYGNSSKKTYAMSVRYLEMNVQCDASALYNEFLKQNIAYEEHIGKHIISYIDIAKSIPIIKKDIFEDNAVLQVQYAEQFNKKESIEEQYNSINNKLKEQLFNNMENMLSFIKTYYLGELVINENKGLLTINGYMENIIEINVEYDFSKWNDYTLSCAICLAKYIYTLPERNNSYVFTFINTPNKNNISIIENNKNILNNNNSNFINMKSYIENKEK